MVGYNLKLGLMHYINKSAVHSVVNALAKRGQRERAKFVIVRSSSEGRALQDAVYFDYHRVTDTLFTCQLVWR